MAEEEFSLLVENMATIGKALELLPPEVRTAAFERMVGALTGSGVPGPRQPFAEDPAEETDAEQSFYGPASDTVATPRRGNNTRRKPKPKQVTARKDINFRPHGKTSFADLVVEKAPTNNYEKNLLIVWWFEETAVIAAIGVPEILAAYRTANWRPPSDPENSLQQTASHKGWIETSDMKNIKTVHEGRNYVEFDMPAEKMARRKQRKVAKKAAKAAA